MVITWNRRSTEGQPLLTGAPGDIDADGEKSLMSMFASNTGSRGTHAPSVPAPETNPCEAKDGPTPPCGLPMRLKSRM